MKRVSRTMCTWNLICVTENDGGHHCRAQISSNGVIRLSPHTHIQNILVVSIELLFHDFEWDDAECYMTFDLWVNCIMFEKFLPSDGEALMYTFNLQYTPSASCRLYKNWTNRQKHHP